MELPKACRVKATSSLHCIKNLHVSRVQLVEPERKFLLCPGRNGSEIGAETIGYVADGSDQQERCSAAPEVSAKRLAVRCVFSSYLQIAAARKPRMASPKGGRIIYSASTILLW